MEIPPQPTQPIVPPGTVRPSDGALPENMPVPPLPEGSENLPVPPQPQGGEDMSMPQLPGGVEPPQDGFGRQPVLTITGTLSTEFPIHEGANHFMQVQPAA